MRFVPVIMLLPALACSQTAWATQPVPFTTIALGSQSGIRTRSEVVIRTPSEWQTLWQKHMAGLPQAPARPAVDFSRDMVIAVFAGEVPAHTRVSIQTMTYQKDRLAVFVRIADLQPGPALADPGTDTPFHIVRLSRSPLPVIFIPARIPDIY